MVNFEEKKPDLGEAEKQERAEVIQLCKDSFNIFKLAMDEQTAKVENGQGTYINTSELEQSKTKLGPEDRINTNIEMMSSARARGGMEDQSRNETQVAFLDESNNIKAKNVKIVGSDLSQQFDSIVHKILRKLEEIEKKYVLGEYDYDEVVTDPYALKFDNTFEAISLVRKPAHCFFDMCLIVFIMCLITLCLQLLKIKGYIETYHITNLPT